jgi:hypothetical protein
MQIAFRLFILWVFIVSAGCQTNSGNIEVTPHTTPTDRPGDYSVIVTIYPVEPMNPDLTAFPQAAPPFDPALDVILSRVRNDLNQKTGIGMEEIHVVEVEAVDWPDSSLGCGEPGTIYLPVITPGFRILLEAHGQIYSYHTDASNRFILCEQP